MIGKKLHQLEEEVWGDSFLGKRFFAETFGAVSLDKYIKNQ
ncbi:MAG: hypothetical protein WBQ73_03800 [Candidatus Babeliales bacterium]